MIVKNTDILKILGPKIKKSRLSHGFTQEYVSEHIGISIDLLRNIENGRNIGSVPTLINLCNLLDLTPNILFSDLLSSKDESFDIVLYDYFKKIPKESKNIMKKIIIHLDKKY